MIIDKDNAFGSRRLEEERGRGRGVDVIIMGHTQTQIRITFSPLATLRFSKLVTSYDDQRLCSRRAAPSTTGPSLLASRPFPRGYDDPGFGRCHGIRSAPALAATLRHLSGA